MTNTVVQFPIPQRSIGSLYDERELSLGGLKKWRENKMGVGELREAFNAVSQPAFTCTLALLDYERVTDPATHRIKEWQVLLFRGTSADGAPFEIKSERHPGDIDINTAAMDTAQKLLDQRKPAS